jgi:hypothetical protein
MVRLVLQSQRFTLGVEKVLRHATAVAAGFVVSAMANKLLATKKFNQ